MSNPLVNVKKDIDILNKLKWNFVPTILEVGIFSRDKPPAVDIERSSGSSSVDSSVFSLGIGTTLVQYYVMERFGPSLSQIIYVLGKLTPKDVLSLGL